MVTFVAIWKLFIGSPKAIARAVLFALVVVGGAYLDHKIRQSERARVDAERAKATIEQLEERAKHDQSVRGLADCDLVTELGGLCDNNTE